MNAIEIVNIQPQHAAQLRQLQLTCFPTINPDELFHEHEFVEIAQVFPRGVFVALDGDRVVGLGSGHYLDFDFDNYRHTMAQAVGRGHNPDGAWYYGTDISVHPDYRGRGIGKRLYELRKGLVKTDNKRGIIAGGLIPGFAHYKHTMDVETYVAKVVAGEIRDNTLTFQIHNGFQVRGILPNYMTIGASDGYATLIVWENPDYRPD